MNFLHRIHKRCTDSDEINHHMHFMLSIMSCRDQNMDEVMRKFNKFKLPKVKNLNVEKQGTRLLLKHDGVSSSHKFSYYCLKVAFESIGLSTPNIVFTSLPKIMAGVSTKRDVIGQVKRNIHRSRN